jgi:hypothetical protein
MFSEKYQWIKGDKVGTVEHYSSHDTEWVYFRSGGRINVNVLPEFMLPAEGDTPMDISITKSKPEPRQREIIQNQKKEDNGPVKALLNQATKEKLQFSYRFDLDIPKATVYNLIKESFEVDVDSIVVDMLMLHIDKNELHKQVKEQVKTQILKFYNHGRESKKPGSQQSTTESLDEQTPA